MNRRKKVNQILKKRAKKANDKQNPKSKPRYISKAERAKLEQEASEQEATASTPDPKAES